MRLPLEIILLAPFIVHVQGLWKPFRQIDRIYPSSIEYYKTRPEVDTKAFKEDLRTMAETAMSHGPYSVTYKKMQPPGGNIHDYYSFSNYWWPKCPSNVTVIDPTHECEYEARDGKLNPDAGDTGDHVQLQNMAMDTMTLTLAWALLDLDRFAEKAATLLRTWFIDPETRMNPNAAFAQTIRGPGKWASRGSGIIDLRFLLEAANAAAVLRQSPAWTTEDHLDLTKWYEELIQWYITSQQGISINKIHNNVKTWYHAQLAGYYILTEKPKMANETIYKFLANDFSEQIAVDGSQPLELVRSSHIHHSNFNLEALIVLAKIGDELGVDVWHHSTVRGASIQTAVQYLMTQELDAEAADELRQHVAAARAKYGNEMFAKPHSIQKGKEYQVTNEAGLIGLTNDHKAPTIDPQNAWPTSKKTANPSAELIAIQQIKNNGDVNWQSHKLQGLDPNVQRGEAGTLKVMCIQNVAIGIAILCMFS